MLSMPPHRGNPAYYSPSVSSFMNTCLLQSFEDDVMYYLIGIVCGLAIYNYIIIPLPFPPVLYKKLLRQLSHLPTDSKKRSNNGCLY